MYFTVCPLRGPGSISDHGGVFQWIFPWLITLYISRDFPWLITLSQPVLSEHGRKWLNLPYMTPHNQQTSRGKTYIQRWTNNGCKGQSAAAECLH